MKQLFGFLMMGLMVSVVGCATNVEKGDELAQQGKYEEAIKLYDQVKSDDGEYKKAQDGIANCNFQLGEIEFNGKNWEKAILYYKRSNPTEKTKYNISVSYFQMAEEALQENNWKQAALSYRKAKINDYVKKIDFCEKKIAAEEQDKADWEIIERGEFEPEYGQYKLPLHEHRSSVYLLGKSFWYKHTLYLLVYSDLSEAEAPFRGMVVINRVKVREGATGADFQRIVLDKKAINDLRNILLKYEQWQNKARELKVEPFGKTLGSVVVKGTLWESGDRRIDLKYSDGDYSYENTKGIAIYPDFLKMYFPSNTIPEIYSALSPSVLKKIRERLNNEIRNRREQETVNKDKKEKKKKLIQDSFR